MELNYLASVPRCCVVSVGKVFAVNIPFAMAFHSLYLMLDLNEQMKTENRKKRNARKK